MYIVKTQIGVIVNKAIGALKLVIFIFKYYKVVSFIYVITSADVFI